ncbi:MAG: SUF system NifU family Fe-S cluster assembly protein [Gemmatimonadetes bacterium]|nr:SUF system NifU family Fe-S cluster assembly protein [Gemmatimonadota bacterium]MCC6770175.1 SUF system NifU family Fe-S cluster assembly protein [Gemmatimonadaceae bacterium]
MDLGSLYQDVILEHNRSPRNWGELAPPSQRADGRNPMCGDEVTVWLTIDNDRVAEVSFVGTGCAISKASASMMTQAVKGKTRAEAEQVFAQFHAMVTGRHANPADDPVLGKLKVFSGVARFPARVKCASLAWHAMKEALDAQP